MKTLKENMRRFKTKNLNEQGDSSLGDAAAALYPRTRQDDEIAFAIEQDLESIRRNMTTGSGKGFFNDDEDMLAEIFENYWKKFGIQDQINSLNDKDPNKRTYMGLKDKLYNNIGGSGKFMPFSSVNVVWNIYVLESSLRNALNKYDTGIAPKRNKPIGNSGIVQIKRRFHTDI